MGVSTSHPRAWVLCTAFCNSYPSLFAIKMKKTTVRFLFTKSWSTVCPPRSLIYTCIHSVYAVPRILANRPQHLSRALAALVPFELPSQSRSPRHGSACPHFRFYWCSCQQAAAAEASTAEGGRGDRARARRHKRNAALGLGDDYAVQRQREKR